MRTASDRQALGMIVDRAVRAVHDARAETVTVGVDVVAIVAPNPRRQSLYICNATQTQPVWVSISPVVDANGGILIKAGESWIVTSPQDSILPQYGWYGIALVPGVNVHVLSIELVGLSALRQGVVDGEQWAGLFVPRSDYSRRRAVQIS